MKKYQTGSAHLALIIALIIVIVGLLGFVFWQNFLNKQSADGTETQTSTDTSTVKTFSDDRYGVSFQYPSDWTVISEDSQGSAMISTKVTVKNKDKTVAVLDVNQHGAGVGGTCTKDDAVPYSTLDATPVELPAVEATVFSATALKAVAEGQDVNLTKYLLGYGLTSGIYTTVNDGTVCPNVFYYVFEPKSDKFVGLSFGTGVVTGSWAPQFDSLDRAKAYVAGDEFQAIKKMILSLSY